MTTTTAVLLGILLVLGAALPVGAGDILGPRKLSTSIRSHRGKSWVVSFQRGMLEDRCDYLTVRQKSHRELIVEVDTPGGQMICQQQGDGIAMRLAWDPGRYSQNTYLVRIWNWSFGPAVTVTLETPK